MVLSLPDQIDYHGYIIQGCSSVFRGSFLFAEWKKEGCDKRVGEERASDSTDIRQHNDNHISERERERERRESESADATINQNRERETE